MFFNIGGAEVLVIAVIALIAVGPEQLPTVIRKVGRAMGQVRSMAAGLRDEFMAGAEDLNDLRDPGSWFGGSGTAEDPVVRRGYADLVHEQDDDPARGNGAGKGKAAGGGADHIPESPDSPGSPESPEGPGAGAPGDAPGDEPATGGGGGIAP